LPRNGAICAEKSPGDQQDERQHRPGGAPGAVVALAAAAAFHLRPRPATVQQLPLEDACRHAVGRAPLEPVRGLETVAQPAASVAMRSPRRWRLAERTMVLGRLFSRRGHIHRLPPPLRKWTVSRDLPGAAAAHLPTVVGEAMTAAREEVLARIRAAIGSTTPEVVPRAYTGAADEAGAVDLLIDRLLDYRARVDRVSPAGVRDAIAAVGTGPFVVPPGLDTGWTTGLDTIADDRLSSGALDRAAGVITDAALAIAETGTIVLDGGPGQGRRAISLVPDLHVCVVRADQVVPGVPEAIARLDPARPLTLISGPSATSDIELSRVEGVHGPRTLHVIIVDPDRSPPPTDRHPDRDTSRRAGNRHPDQEIRLY
jgi:L-lactate dehydrogenase complex protein LldG